MDMDVKLHGIGPVKVGKIHEQFNWSQVTIEYYFWFASEPILLARRWL